MSIINSIKRTLGAVGLAFGLAVAAATGVQAQTTTDPVTDATEKIDQVQTVGAKAYAIAAGLALTGVVIGFIRKAKR